MEERSPLALETGCGAVILRVEESKRHPDIGDLSTAETRLRNTCDRSEKLAAILPGEDRLGITRCELRPRTELSRVLEETRFEKLGGSAGQ